MRRILSVVLLAAVAFSVMAVPAFSTVEAAGRIMVQDPGGGGGGDPPTGDPGGDTPEGPVWICHWVYHNGLWFVRCYKAGG